jgi:hypothetical protein
LARVVLSNYHHKFSGKFPKPAILPPAHPTEFFSKQKICVHWW